MTTATLEAPAAIDPLDHQGLVYQIAIRHRGRGVDVDDLVQEGQFGLLEACKKFDPGRGTKFSTYAVYWVKHFIRVAIKNQSGFVRVPVYMQEKARKGERPDDPGLTPKQREALAAAIRLRGAKIAGSSDLAAKDMVLADVAVAPTPEVLDPEELHQVVRAIVTLPVPLRRVLRLRYGLTGHEPMTQATIAARFGTTRQRVHQLEHEAIDQLRERIGGAA